MSHVLTGTKELIEEINSVIYHGEQEKKREMSRREYIKKLFVRVHLYIVFKNYNDQKKTKGETATLLNSIRCSSLVNVGAFKCIQSTYLHTRYRFENTPDDVLFNLWKKATPTACKLYQRKCVHQES